MTSKLYNLSALHSLLFLSRSILVLVSNGRELVAPRIIQREVGSLIKITS